MIANCSLLRPLSAASLGVCVLILLYYAGIPVDDHHQVVLNSTVTTTPTTTPACRRSCPWPAVANGKGYFYGDTFIHSSGCQLKWFEREDIAHNLKGKWLAFFGDSDTRGLVLSLLQLLDLQQSEPFSPERWWNITFDTEQPLKKATKIYHTDWVFSSSGDPTEKCTSSLAQSNRPQCAPHDDADCYNFTPRCLDNDDNAFRITYCYTSTMENFRDTLDKYTANLPTMLQQPDLMYINTGAWNLSDILPQALAHSINTLAAQSQPTQLLWGTSLSHRRPWVDRSVCPLLDRTIPILNRRSFNVKLRGARGNTMEKRVRLSNSHVPHMNNIYDIQRIMSYIAYEMNEVEEEEECVAKYRVRFERSCKGKVSVFPAEEEAFIEAWLQKCIFSKMDV